MGLKNMFENATLSNFILTRLFKKNAALLTI